MLYQLSHVRAHLGCVQNCSRSCRWRKLGVLLTSQSLARTDRGASASTRFVVTGAGARTLASFGINVAEVRRLRRRFAGQRIDWTQRRGHRSGALGLADTFGLDLGLHA